jgi:outer membrane protein insertion porin family
MRQYRLQVLLSLAAIFFSCQLFAEEFIIKDIQVQGLERISSGAVFSQMPVDIGDEFDTSQSSEIIRSLYKSGFFDDISLGRDGDVMIVKVKERPAIADITFEGNKDIPTDKLTEALKQADIAKGRVFDRSVLESLERELRQQYFSRGKYNLKIDTEVKELKDNRVDIDINISEGVVTKIKRVNLIGNHQFTDEELMGDFGSGIPSWWALLSSKDEYSKQKLAGDLEILRSFYLDRGYVNFNIDSTQVTITPDKKDIYVTINITEGEKFTVSDVELSGELVFSEEELRKELTLEQDETFSRAKIASSTKALKDKLGAKGYAFSEVDVIPKLDENANSAALNFQIKPGKRVYVRRINFSGNSKTRDEVLRREMRQMEGGWYSSPKVDRSRVRIQRLPFVESVDFERKRVPDRDDMVDLDVTVSERFAGSFSANIGYSEAQGAIFGLSLNQENAFGSGQRLALEFNNSKANNVYSISFTDPYYTVNGVSRGFTAFYRTTNAEENNVSSYLTDRWGVGMNFGIPLSENDRIRFNMNYEDIEVEQTDKTPVQITDFITENGDDYGLFTLSTTYIHDTRDRTIFPNEGNVQKLNLEATVPGSDLDFYKTSYRSLWYWPLNDTYTFSTMANLAYGEGYDGSDELPFFEKYYAGGIRSVRGYNSNSLGPLSTPPGTEIPNGDPFGGNFRVLANAQLYFPAPFAKDNRSARMSLFVDAGNVFANSHDFESSELRTSAGVSFEWLTPVGPLVFSLADALNNKPGDDTRSFQFSIGGAF